MNTLVWAIKGSLLDYVSAMADGVIELHGVIETTAGFVFGSDAAAPDEGSLRFRGSVEITGHGGMMHLVFADPWLAPHGAGWLLSIADDQTASGRLDFASIVALHDAAENTLVASGTALTADGADLFFGPYREGTPLDDPVVRKD